MKSVTWLLAGSLLIATSATAIAVAKQAAAKSTPVGVAARAGEHAVDARYVFGMQYVPKYDERQHKGAWEGSRSRGLALHRDLGVQVSREGLLWKAWEPTAPGQRPNLADFDDAVNRLAGAGIAMQAMVTETPLWASTATHANPQDPASFKSAVPRGLNAPIFADGSDTPGPNKRANPANTFALALAEMVDRYHGKVRYWQIWNEPDYPKGDQAAAEDSARSFFGSVDDYVRLLKVGYAIVKSRDPHAQVVTGGIGYAPYLQAMLDRGAGRYFDQVDFHAYGWPGSEAALGKFVEVHDAMRRVLDRNGLQAKRLICSETGYTALQPDNQAAYIAKLYPTAIALGLESTMYYATCNPSWKTMGLYDWHTLGQKTAGYWAYKNASLALHDVTRAAALALPGASGYRFTRRDGTQVYALWAPNHDAHHPLAASLNAPVGPYQLHDDLGRPMARPHGGTLHLALTDAPVWLDSDMHRAYTPMRANPPLPRPGLPLASASADSVNENQGAPDAAIDTDTDTNWANGAYKSRSAWLAVALAHRAPVSKLHLKTGPTPVGTWFDVEVSDDGQQYHTVAAHQRLASWQMEWLALPQPAPASTRFVRLHWHNPERRPVSFGVFELEAY